MFYTMDLQQPHLQEVDSFTARFDGPQELVHLLKDLIESCYLSQDFTEKANVMVNDRTAIKLRT